MPFYLKFDGSGNYNQFFRRQDFAFNNVNDLVKRKYLWGTLSGKAKEWFRWHWIPLPLPRTRLFSRVPEPKVFLLVKLKFCMHYYLALFRVLQELQFCPDFSTPWGWYSFFFSDYLFLKLYTFFIAAAVLRVKRTACLPFCVFVWVIGC